MNNQPDPQHQSEARRRGNTFRAIDLQALKLSTLPFDKFVEALFDKLEDFKKERAVFYEGLRRRNANWAYGARAVLAVLGSLALLLTALAALAPRIGSGTSGWFPDAQSILTGVLIIYAVMGAISFYEKGSDKTTSYFREVATILAIRDLWTKFQFAVLKELLGVSGTTDPTTITAARDRICTLAESFCADVDKLATGELAEFRTEFLASLADFDEVSRKGRDEISKQIAEGAKLAEKAAADAAKAAADAAAALKAAENAAKPGFLNLTITGDFDDEVAVMIAGVERARSRGKTLVVDQVAPGLTKVAAQAKKGQKVLEGALAVDVKPGLQDVRLVLG